MILSPSPAFDILNSAGTGPASGYQMFSYAAGTTTKQNSYTDSGGGTALPNPILLNTRGDVAASANGASTGLWIDPTLTYKFVLTLPTAGDPPSSSIWTIDNVVNPVAAVLAALSAYEAQLGGIPIGGILPFGGGTVPAGWQLCYGQAISRTTYSALFAVIGTSFGIGDGSTTFNVPDLRSRYPLGADAMGGTPANRVSFSVAGITAATVGMVGGSQYAQADTLTAVVTPTVHVTDPGHAHQENVGQGAAGSSLVWNIGANNGTPTVAANLNTQTATTAMTITATATATVSTSLTGASQNMPPVQVSNYIIYASV